MTTPTTTPTKMPPATRIEVVAGATGVRCLLVQGALSPRRLRASETRGTVRLALVAAAALLLAGDEVRLEVVVDGPVVLEVVEVAGTVAYDMRGDSARWDLDIVLRNGAGLTWAGESFVVCGGADVDREPLVVETLDLGAAGRSGWAVLGDARCLETVTSYGVRLPGSPATLQSEGPSSTVRTLGDRFHLSRSPTAWEDARRAVHPGPVPVAAPP